MAFTGYEVRMDFRINGIKPIKALPGYEARVGFKINGIKPIKALPGYLCLKSTV
ncbi:MAG: hypothetical protein OXU36_15475 [Candidatus Poribacteria bacterium]|nr:hypothetical protein [Candidatus Poribacteria bacterium]